MTETSKKRYLITESCRLMRGAKEPFPNTLASVAPKSFCARTVDCDGFDRYIERLFAPKSL